MHPWICCCYITQNPRKVTSIDNSTSLIHTNIATALDLECPLPLPLPPGGVKGMVVVVGAGGFPFGDNCGEICTWGGNGDDDGEGNGDGGLLLIAGAASWTEMATFWPMQQ